MRELEVGQLEQRLHQEFGIDRARPRLQHEPDVFSRLVTHVGEQRQLLVVEEAGDLLDQARLLHLPGDFRDHDDVSAASGVLLYPARAHAEAAAAGRVGLRDGLARVDDQAAGRQIGPRHELQEIAALGAGMLDEMQGGVAQLGGVVRWNCGRHADGDPLRAVGEEVGEGARQHHRLFLGAVVGRTEGDRILVEPVQHQPGDLGQPRLRVAHGGRIIAVDIAEIALAVDRRVALGEVLGEPHQRVVDRLVAMRVELADHVADDARAFLAGRARVETEQTHGVEQPAVHWLQPVARVRQRPVHDRRQRIGEVALLEGRAQCDVVHLGGIGGNQDVAHGGWLTRDHGANNPRRHTEKLVPHPQEAAAIGLLILNDAPIRSST